MGLEGAIEGPWVGNVGFVGNAPSPRFIPESPVPEGVERPKGAMLGPVGKRPAVTEYCCGIAMEVATDDGAANEWIAGRC